MAASVATPTVTKAFNFGQVYGVVGTISVSVSVTDYSSGGIALSFFQDLIKARQVPIWVLIWGQQSQNGQAQYDYSYIPGVDASAGLLKICTGGSEISGSAVVPTGVTGDVINFFAIFNGQL